MKTNDVTRQTETSLKIRDLETEADAMAFRMLNEEWIIGLFRLEPKDVETLGDPQRTILDKGGRVFLALDGTEHVGCVALIPMGEGRYELSKMAVSPEMRGRGVGRLLVAHLISEARAMGARGLFLGSSTRLPNAVHLYEAMGFKHVPLDRLPPMEYQRADVFMELEL